MQSRAERGSTTRISSPRMTSDAIAPTKHNVAEKNEAEMTPFAETVRIGERKRTARVNSLSPVPLVIHEKGGILELRLQSRSYITAQVLSHQSLFCYS